MITYLEHKNIFTSRLAFARMLLALSALLFVSFNDVGKMLSFLDQDHLNNVPFNKINIFLVLGPVWGRIISALILLAVCSGYYPQITCFLQSWVHLSICNAIIFIEGGDQIASNLSLLLIPVCLLDKRRNQWTDIPDAQQNSLQRHINVFANVYYFVIQAQVAVIYLHAALGKLGKEDWLSGTSLYFWTTHNVFGAPLWIQKIYNFFLLSSFAPVFTWLVLIFELLLFACILATSNKVRRSFLILGILFHFGIVVTHGLITFFFAMAGALVLFLDAENYCVKTLKRIFSKKKKTAEAYVIARAQPVQ